MTRTFTLQCRCGLQEENLTEATAQTRAEFHLAQQTRRSYQHATSILRAPSSKWSWHSASSKGANKILGRWTR